MNTPELYHIKARRAGMTDAFLQEMKQEIRERIKQNNTIPVKTMELIQRDIGITLPGIIWYNGMQKRGRGICDDYILTGAGRTGGNANETKPGACDSQFGKACFDIICAYSAMRNELIN